MKKLILLFLILSSTLLGQSKDTSLFIFSPYGSIITADLIKLYPNRQYIDILKTSTQFSNWGGSFKGSKLYEISNQINGIPSVSMFNLPYEAISKIETFDGAYPAENSFMSTNTINNSLNSGNGTLSIYAGYETDNILFKSGNDLYNRKILDSYWFGYNNLTLRAEGSIGSRIDYFFLFNQNYILDKDPKAYPGIQMDNVYAEFYNTDGTSSTGTIDYRYPSGPRLSASDLTNTFIGNMNIKPFQNLALNIFGIYQTNRYYEPASYKLIYTLSTSPLYTKNQLLAGLNLKWDINSVIQYSFSAGYSYQLNMLSDPVWKDNILLYGYNSVNYVYIADFFSCINGEFHYNTQFYKKEYDLFSSSSVFSIKISDTDLLKAGFNLQKYTYRKFETPYSLWYGTEISYYLLHGIEPRLDFRYYYADIIGYDNYLNPTADDGVFGKREPVILNVFIENKYDFDNGYFLLGAKYDYFNPDNYITIDELNPLDAFNSDGTLSYDKIKQTDAYNLISPVLNFKYSLSEKTDLYGGFGINAQIPNLDEIYTDIFYFYINDDGMDIDRASAYQFTIKPIKTTMYDLSLTHKLTDNLNLIVKSYLKRIVDIPTIGSNSSNNFSYDSDGKTTIAGANLLLNMSNFHNISGSIDFAYTYSNGVSANNTSKNGYGYTYSNSTNSYYIYEYNDVELENLSRFAGKLFLNYKLVSSSCIFDNFNFSLYYYFNSGHTYHKTTSVLFNGATTPNNHQIDLMISKLFQVGGIGSFELYIYAINLFNIRNVINVYPYSGDPDNDGKTYIIYDNYYNYLLTEYGKTRADNYLKIANQINAQASESNYGTPRMIRLGIKLNI